MRDSWTASLALFNGIPLRLRMLVMTDGRTISEVAEAAGMSLAQLSQIINGYRINPSARTLSRILAALGKTWSDLDPAPMR